MVFTSNCAAAIVRQYGEQFDTRRRVRPTCPPACAPVSPGRPSPHRRRPTRGWLAGLSAAPKLVRGTTTPSVAGYEDPIGQGVLGAHPDPTGKATYERFR